MRYKIENTIDYYTMSHYPKLLMFSFCQIPIQLTTDRCYNRRIMF